MTKKRIHRKIERTVEEQHLLDDIRCRFQKQKLGLDELLANVELPLYQQCRHQADHSLDLRNRRLSVS